MLSVNQLLVRSGEFSRRQLRRSRLSIRTEDGRPLDLRSRLAIDPTPARLLIDDFLELDYWREPPALVALHKPRGYVVSRSEPGTTNLPVHELLADHPQCGTLQPIGRLDAESEGLLLFTEDGQLQHRLLHPRNALPRTYLCTLDTPPEARRWAQLWEGRLRLRDGHVPTPLRARILSVPTPPLPAGDRIATPENHDGLSVDPSPADDRITTPEGHDGRTVDPSPADDRITTPEGHDARYLLREAHAHLVEIVLSEGKYHEVRRAMAACGATVERLLRTEYASLSLRGCELLERPGAWCAVEGEARDALYASVHLEDESSSIRVRLSAPVGL